MHLALEERLGLPDRPVPIVVFVETYARQEEPGEEVLVVLGTNTRRKLAPSFLACASASQPMRSVPWSMKNS